MKKLLLVALLTITLTGCIGQSSNSDKKTSEQQEALMQESNAQVGMPAITRFKEKKLAKMIFELRDREDLITYAYIVNHMTGDLVFIGECIGYGLPYSVQYTNPMRRDWSSIEGGVGYLPQADPNGLFMPDGLSATWLMMIDPETGDPRPVYVEPEILISPFKLHSI